MDVFHNPQRVGFTTLTVAFEEGTATSVATLVSILFTLNLVLFVFNLLPVPPLDGSTVLANFHRPYANWLRDNYQSAGYFFMGYFVLIMVLERTPYGLFRISRNVANWYISLF